MKYNLMIILSEKWN